MNEEKCPPESREEGGGKGLLARFVPDAFAKKASRWLQKYYLSTSPYRLSLTDRMTCLGLLVFFFCLYLYTCSHHPNIAGDSPELIGGAYSLGVVHPPGYPLYTLIGYLFTRLPVGSIAFRVNLSSVVYHSLALALFFTCTIKLTRSRAVAAISTAALGFSPLFWFYSLMAEVFPLNDLLLMVLIYTSIRAREKWQQGDRRGSSRTLAVLFFLCGLSLCHHHTIILIFPTAFLLALEPLLATIRRARFALLCAGAFLLGLLPYIYLPISASRGPYINFGDPSTLKNFLNVVTRRYYGTAKLWKGLSAEHRLDLVLQYLKTLGQQVYTLGIILGTLGMFRMARRRRGDFIPLITGFVAGGVVFPIIANVKLLGPFHLSTIERFFLFPTIIFFMFVAEGIAAILEKARDLLAGTGLREDILKGAAWTLALILALPLILPAPKVSESVNLKYDALGEAYIHNMLESVDEGSLIFVQGDVPIQLLEYYNTCVKNGKKVYVIILTFMFNTWYAETVHQWYPELSFPLLSDLPLYKGIPEDELNLLYIQYIVAHNPQVTSFHTITMPSYLREHFDLLPWGITFRILPKDAEVDMGHYLGRQLDFWRRADLQGMGINFYRSDSREYDFLSYLSQFPLECARYLNGHGLSREALSFLLISNDIAPTVDCLREIAGIFKSQGDLRDFYAVYKTTLGMKEYDNAVLAEELLELESALKGERGSEDAR